MTKEQREKDRRTGMSNSSVHAHSKKEGHGGRFVEGDPLDPSQQQEVQNDAGDPLNDSNEPTAPPSNAPVAEQKRVDKKSVPLDTEENFPELGAPVTDHGPQGAWKK
eukprot:GEMP01090012.1.p1 GENE.GEMP01090012.1~~GEMP01090012.1.p1  ORF type:complete len:107 (+),score=33.21 GEMP01090012.1:45-365(+)